MIKCNAIICFLALLFASQGWSQNKYEQERKIPKTEFPSNAYQLISNYLESAKRIRFYRETDSVKQSFEAKFKKGRLHYSVEFDELGVLEDVEFRIKEADIPEESWANITLYLQKEFSKFRIVKIQQQYPAGNNSSEKTLEQAFQNLMLPHINYELVFSSKNNKGFQTYEALFNAGGSLVKLRKSLPPSYDHVLY